MYRPLALVLVAFALAMGVPTTATAHTPRPAACTLVWQATPPGQKFAAQQRCLAAQWRHRCQTHQRVVPGSVRVEGVYLKPGRRHSPHWRNQRKVVAWLVNEGIRRRLPRKLIITAVATGTQESSLRELTYGDGTSLGPLQLIDRHGSPQQRISIEFSGSWFYNGVQRTHRQRPYLSIQELSHSQQASAHPYAVEKWIREATRTVDLVLTPACRLA